MRDIKFRSWDKDKKRFLFLENGDFELSYSGAYIPLEYGGRDCVKNNLEQYTGLKDKNGKEIYEGDILEIEYIHTSFIAVVAFENGFFGWIEKDSADIYPIAEYIHQGIKVIGNIHENPELLEGV